MRILTLFFLLAPFYLNAQHYAIDQIPLTLKSRATAIVRSETIQMDLRNDGQLIEKVSRVISILNSAGEDHAELLLFYNQGKSIKSITGFIYNEFGVQIRKFNTKDFEDYSATDNSTMFGDARFKRYNPNLHQYPYTISYSYEIKHNQNLVIPYWTPNIQHDIAVENSSYEIISKAAEELRIQELNIPTAATIVRSEKGNSYTWKATNIPAQKDEAYSPRDLPTDIYVKVVPKNFKFFQKTGSGENWKDFGQWYYDQLLKDKHDLSEQAKKEVQSIIAPYSTNAEKAKALYTYMQSKTRYISIQVGIGGFEPFPASYVEKYGYGDCKALVNYMQALLAEANILSYFCIVEAGNYKVDLSKDFANIVDGNHIILCIPTASDTTWLECTSNKAPFGFLGDFTDDRLVLACTPEGGKLLRTKKYPAASNLQTRKGNFIVDASGSIKGHIETIFSGAQFDNHFSNLSLSPLELNKALKENYDVDNITFTNPNYQLNTQEIGEEASLTENIEISLKNYVVKNGNSLVLQPNIFNHASTIPQVRNRNNKIYINRGYTDIDELVFTLSEKIADKIMPTIKMIECPMGKYEFRVSTKDNKVFLYRKIELKDGMYPAEDYPKFFDFMNSISSMDRGKYTLPLAQ